MLYEPAFYASVVQDWGTHLMIAQHLGPQAMCLVDLGHHAPDVNIAMMVSRLFHAGKLGGFHFNNSKYGDDGLDAGAIDPFRAAGHRAKRAAERPEVSGLWFRACGFGPAGSGRWFLEWGGGGIV